MSLGIIVGIFKKRFLEEKELLVFLIQLFLLEAD
jgi:hypothetical protein